MTPVGWKEGKISDVITALEAGVSAVSYGVFNENAQKVISKKEELSRAKTNSKAGQIIISHSNTGVNGHVSDTEQWVVQSFEQYGIKHFDEKEAFGLGLHINKMFKKAKSPLGIKERFYPVARFFI